MACVGGRSSVILSEDGWVVKDKLDCFDSVELGLELGLACFKDVAWADGLDRSLVSLVPSVSGRGVDLSV